MEITSRRRRGGGEDGDKLVITIALDTAVDDPQNILNGLVLKGRLEALLRAVGRPGDDSRYESDQDLLEALQRVGFVAGLAEGAVDHLILAARDAGLSYGQIATALDLHRQTVVYRVERLRKAQQDDTSTQEDA